MKKVNLLCVCIVLLIASCKNEHKPDISKIKIDYKSIRFDKAFFAIDTNNINEGLKNLYAKYPDFAELFTTKITGWGKYNDTAKTVLAAAHHFLTYKDYKGLYDTVQEKYPVTTQTDNDIKEALTYIKYYWPDYKIPVVYYFISGLNYYSAVTYDGLVGVGLDMHLGKNYMYYPAVQIPDYQIQKCEPTYIVPNLVKAIYEDKIPFNNEGKNLLDMIIQKGKQLYFMDLVLPDVPNEIKIGYTVEQLKWCQANQAMIWNFFVQNNLLYNTELQQTMRYVLDGVNTPGMPKESPGNVGSFIGWQIVKQYMGKKPNTSLQDLQSNKIAAQEILQTSGYKPK